MKGQDDATENRLKFIETSYSYLHGDLYESKKLNPNVRKADPELKSVWLKRKDVLEACRVFGFRYSLVRGFNHAVSFELVQDRISKSERRRGPRA